MNATRSRGPQRGVLTHYQGRDWVTAANARLLLGTDVTPDMLYDWARRGLVLKISNGRVALYLWSQVKAAEARASGRSQGRKRAAGDREAAGGMGLAV